ncbi:MAG: phosphoglycerate kinase, partial [Patescibacteria group bacterium]
MPSILDLTNLRGRYVLVRASLNVPLQDGVVRSSFRIKRALETLRYLHEQGARTIILSHIGRNEADTLKPVYEALADHLPLQWGGRVTGEEFRARRELMQNGDLLLAENLRQDPREVANDPAFATELASLGELYINDAFAEVHREHASLAALAEQLPAYAGLSLLAEITALQTAREPQSPALFLLGGAKFETKLPLVEEYLKRYDHVFIGGALANDILKARGYAVGRSLVSAVDLSASPLIQHEKLLVPIDLLIEGPAGVRADELSSVGPEERIMDCGPKTVAMLAEHINAAATILWNGPFGAYEQGFTEATEQTARFIAGADG